MNPYVDVKGLVSMPIWESLTLQMTDGNENL